ncbi:MAG: TraB/GumN family protein [Bacteroidales bacterium]|nr:TraB/GumN family protein [Bacteroidales bacterium]
MKVKRMKRSIVGVLTLCILMFNILHTVAQNNSKPNKVCLWELENSQNKVYLLGSLHLLPEDVYPLDERISNSFKASDILVVEADITKNPEEVQKLIAQEAFFKDGNNLKKVLSEEMYSSLSSEFKGLGVDIEKLNNFKPWFVTMNLGALRSSKIDVKPGAGIDVHFLNSANERDMKILELESVALQLELHSSQSINSQIDNLQYLLEESNQNEQYLKMLEAWKIGNENELNNLSRIEMKEAGKKFTGVKEQYEKMFIERDEAMLDKITSYLNDDTGKTYFIIVGIFHLVGEDGLIKMLEAKGYKTKQL